MLLMNSNYENNETLNFQDLNYSKVNTCFSWSGKTADSDQWNDLKKDSKQCYHNSENVQERTNRFSEKSDY